MASVSAAGNFVFIARVGVMRGPRSGGTEASIQGDRSEVDCLESNWLGSAAEHGKPISFIEVRLLDGKRS